ncbi:MAG: diguanylate cyclase [Anaerolineales bacterium]|nr:diguanylate cyclase [Anaerolineales bacterium]
MKTPIVNNLKISDMVVASARKRLSIFVAGFSLIGMILTYLFIRDTQVLISYLFLIAITIAAFLIVLFYLEKYVAAQQFAVLALWCLFAFIGISQGNTNTIMITGFLMLVMISGYAFYLKGVIQLVIASSFVLIITGWMDINEISIFKVTLLEPQAKVAVGLLFLLIGGSYYITSLEILGRNYLQVREYQRRYLALFNDSIDAIVILSLEMEILDMNPIGLTLTGYTLDEVKRLAAEDLVVNLEAYAPIWEELSKHRKVDAIEHQVIAKNGDLIDVESIPTEVTDEEGNTLYYQVHLRDVRSRKRVEQYLNDFKQRYEAMFERAEYGFLLLNKDLEIVAANYQAAEIFRCDYASLHNQSLKKILKSGSFSNLKNDIDTFRMNGELPPRRYRLVTKPGYTIWIEANIGLVGANGDQPQYLQWIIRDITEQKQRESQLLNALQEMETLAMTDPLTGLHNRRSIQHYGQMQLENCILESKPFCVILIDVDALKKINDTFGHLSGDQALSQCGQMLVEGKRRDDAVGRWGGDEFLMVLPNTSLDDAEVVAHRILNKIKQVKIGTASNRISLAVSMGLAGSDAAADFEELGFETMVAMADQSMYQAKENKGGQISVSYSPASNFPA